MRAGQLISKIVTPCVHTAQHAAKAATAYNEGEESMAKVYVEARPKGRPEGFRIDDYVVETEGDQVLGIFRTQKEAVDWSKAKGHTPHVARVRNLNDKKRPDHWRAA